MMAIIYDSPRRKLRHLVDAERALVKNLPEPRLLSEPRTKTSAPQAGTTATGRCEFKKSKLS